MAEESKPASKEAEPTQPQEASNWPLIKRMGLTALLIILVVYVGWWTMLYSMQDDIVFPRSGLPPASSSPRYKNTVVLEHMQPTGELSRAWFVPAPKASKDRPAPLAVFLHGNAELIDYQDDIAVLYNGLGCSLLLPEYRGYGQSGGTPTREGILEDAIAFVDQALARPDVDKSRIVYHGRSLGGAVAAELALERKPSVLILQSTFTSAMDMASRFAAPKFLIRHRFDAKSAVEQLNIPMLIFHGTNDEVVPVKHGRALSKAAGNAQYVEYAIDHNNFPGKANGQDYIRTVMGFLIDNKVVIPATEADDATTDTPEADTSAKEAPTSAPATQPADPN